MKGPPLERPVGRILALLCLVVASPLLATAAIAIKLSSKGPVMFRAARIGRGGTSFTMLKLRTMHTRSGGPAEHITGSKDARVFRIGRWLRRVKLDEVPQLVNVVRGEMAFIGPRPEAPAIVEEHYTNLMRETLSVLPGLTSPGSLAYYADEATLPDSAVDAQRVYLTDILPRKIALDLVYIRNRSWRYDAEIVIRTIAAIFGAHGLFRTRRAWESAEAEALRRASGALLAGSAE